MVHYANLIDLEGVDHILELGIELCDCLPNLLNLTDRFPLKTIVVLLLLSLALACKLDVPKDLGLAEPEHFGFIREVYPTLD